MDYLLIQVNPYEEIIGLYLSNLGKSANDLPGSQAAKAKLLEVTTLPADLFGVIGHFT